MVSSKFCFLLTVVWHKQHGRSHTSHLRQPHCCRLPSQHQTISKSHWIMQGMLVHSERQSRHKRREIKQIILQEYILYNVEGLWSYQRWDKRHEVRGKNSPNLQRQRWETWRMQKCIFIQQNTYQAKKLSEKVLLISKEIGDRKGEACCHGNLGAVCQSVGEYEKAIEHLEKSACHWERNWK